MLTLFALKSMEFLAKTQKIHFSQKFVNSQIQKVRIFHAVMGLKMKHKEVMGLEDGISSAKAI